MRRWPNLKAENLTAKALTEEDAGVIADGDVAEAFLASPYWKLTLDWLEQREDLALNAMRLSRSSDSAVALTLQKMWQERRAVLNEFQEYVNGKVLAKRALIEAQEEDDGG